MFESGEIILQEKTMVNGVNYKDNKINRLSVVLFSFFIDDIEYVCSCPITNHKITYNKPQNNFLYIPYELLDDKKLCCIKLDSSFMYPINQVTSTKLNLNKETLLKLYNAILKLENSSLNKEHYEFIKNNIIEIKNNFEEKENRRIKEEKRLKKQLRKEKKYQKIKNK